jgi:hypothetical protein
MYFSYYKPFIVRGKAIVGQVFQADGETKYTNLLYSISLPDFTLNESAEIP